MEDILAQKQSWRHSERSGHDRRQKDGSKEDRKTTADELRSGHNVELNKRAIERKMEHSAFMVSICMLLALSMIVFFCHYAHAYTESEAVRCVVGEASNQGYKGMLGVSEVIRHRGSLSGIYGCSAHHVVTEPNRIWIKALSAYRASANTNITYDANGFENIKDFNMPLWAYGCVVTTKIGDHTFFRCGGA